MYFWKCPDLDLNRYSSVFCGTWHTIPAAVSVQIGAILAYFFTWMVDFYFHFDCSVKQRNVHQLQRFSPSLAGNFICHCESPEKVNQVCQRDGFKFHTLTCFGFKVNLGAHTVPERDAWTRTIIEVPQRYRVRCQILRLLQNARIEHYCNQKNFFFFFIKNTLNAGKKKISMQEMFYVKRNLLDLGGKSYPDLSTACTA